MTLKFVSELGHGDQRTLVVPTKIAALNQKRIVQIACGDHHTLCLDDTGYVFSFGCATNGIFLYKKFIMCEHEYMCVCVRVCMCVWVLLLCAGNLCISMLM